MDYHDDITETEEALTELYETHTPRDRFAVNQAIDSGDRSAIVNALAEIAQAEQQFREGVAALGASPKEVQGLVDRLEREADMMRAELEQRLHEEVAKETGMTVWAANEGMVYRGPIVDQDQRFQYQQVAPKTLIAHDVDKPINLSDRGIGISMDGGKNRVQGMEIGNGR